MKRLVVAFLSLIVISVGASAMSYEQAREQALFLTDKMAYELNLTPEQYDAAYEVNFDYLRGVTTADDVFGVYWEHRNIDLGYILLDWQYRMFTDCLWFYRPLYWDAGIWHFRIYGRYPYRDVFYFDRPVIYINYSGGHCWRHCGSSWYRGRTYGHPSRIGERSGSGMRNNWDGRNRSYSGRSSSAHSGSFTPASRNSSRATAGNGDRSDNRGTSTATHDGRANRGTSRGTNYAGNGVDNRRGGINGTTTQGGHTGSFHRSSDGTSTRTYGASSSSRTYGTSTSSDKGTTVTRNNDKHTSHQYGTVTPSSTRSYGSSSSSTRSYGSSSRSYGGYSGGSRSYGGGRSGGFSGGHSGGHSGGFSGHGGRGR